MSHEQQQNAVAVASGRVLRVEVIEGQQVKQGSRLLVMEKSMKGEVPVDAPCSGTVLRILVSEGDMVVNAQVVATLAPAAR